MTSIHARAAAALGALSALTLATAVPAGYTETWNADPNDNGDVPLTWTANGGAAPAPSGYVAADLGDATSWTPTGAGIFFLAYTYDSWHRIDLATDPRVYIALRDGGGLGLDGGLLCFWIGEYDDPDGPTGPINPTLAFYYYDRVLTYGAADWVVNAIDTAGGQWVAFANQGGPSVADLLTHPQQWGFGLFGGGDTPVGTLALDNYGVPVPAPLPLIVLGLAGLRQARCRG
ncbi:hypothetical protein [uncultured Thiodictyon sp.]|jgi:hypothetical protein|uniref:hypothetical protein n=1 Tax=uncultured Thiodictyon sp. TaxID=1846217 RepID=UPI0025E6AC3E|nr:hypothetical protein [uncultured Thiodictyon sp.]